MSFLTRSPEIATVGESTQAYLQRFVVIALSTYCLYFSVYNYVMDCRLLEISRDGPIVESELLGEVTDSIAQIMDAVGVNTVEIDESFCEDTTITNPWECQTEDKDLFLYGLQGYTFVVESELENAAAFFWGPYQCTSWSWLEDPTRLEQGSSYYNYTVSLHVLSVLAPCFGFIGIMCTLAETWFFVFYPSILLGTISLALASACIIAMVCTALFYENSVIECLMSTQCSLGVNFYTYIFSSFGFIFSSCLLLMGKRAYPWCLRKNRDPAHCKSIDAEVLDEGNDVESDYGTAVMKEEESTVEQLERDLEDTKEKLFVSEEKLLDALYRAEKAEAALRTQSQDNSSGQYRPEPNGTKEADGPGLQDDSFGHGVFEDKNEE
mmetsp:Transcript_13521/g.30146  ORF Transcript_13521/g.30146 Transcript_13521/m.30146 type:complete len:380 (+) Transcript_13521:146-1285(+)